MKKLFSVALSLMLFLTPFLFSDTYSIPNKKAYDSSMEDEDLFKKNDKTVFTNLEFLYWTASAGANEYAFQYDRAVPATGNLYALGKYKFAEYDWDPSFRIALGWFNAPKYWQLYGQFTWVRINGSDSSNRTSNASEPLVGTFAQNLVLGQELANARSKIKLNHELGDLVIARVFIPNPHLRLRLCGALTAGRMQQKWNITYTDVTDQIERVFREWKFIGVGFRMGLDFEWFWGNDFYLGGKTTFAPFVGKYTNRGSIFNEGSNTYFEDVKYDQYRGAFNIQFLLGPSYQKSFRCNRIELFAGYELNSWFNVHEIIRTSGQANAQLFYSEKLARINNGMFLLHGLSTRLTIDF